MSFKVQLYAFSKKLNSTARPTGTVTEYDCVLKAGCGIMSPVISLDIGVLAAPTVFNYAYIPTFLRYYFVKDWYFEDRLWHAYLEEDPLATWKTYIGDTDLYILRAAARHNGAICDDLYPTYPEPVIEYKAANITPWTGDLDSGKYVVGIINKSNSAVGAVSYYVLTPGEFNTLKALLMTNTTWLDVPSDIMSGGIDNNLLRTLFNPFQYIVSCKWYPFSPPTSGSQLSSLPYGWWDMPVTCYKLNPDTNFTTSFHFDKPHHIDNRIQTDNIYLDCEPFTRMELCVEPFGSTVLDSGCYSALTVVRAYVTVDCVTGIGILEVEKGSSVGSTKKVSCQFGVDIQLAQIAVDKLNQAETFITGGLDVASRSLETASKATNISNLLNPVGGSLEAVASGAQTVATRVHAIADGIRASIPQMQTSGINGSVAAFNISPFIKYTYYRQLTKDIQNDGLPLCTIIKPSTLATGYMLVKDGHIAFNGTANEIAAVKAYLESGFYYE